MWHGPDIEFIRIGLTMTTQSFFMLPHYLLYQCNFSGDNTFIFVVIVKLRFWPPQTTHSKFPQPKENSVKTWLKVKGILVFVNDSLAFKVVCPKSETCNCVQGEFYINEYLVPFSYKIALPFLCCEKNRFASLSINYVCN